MMTSFPVCFNQNAVRANFTLVVPDDEEVATTLDVVICLLVIVVVFALDRSLRPRGRVSDALTQKLCCEEDIVPEMAFSGSNKEKSFLMEVFKERADEGNTDAMMKALQAIEDHCIPCLVLQDYHCLILRLCHVGKPINAHIWLRRCWDAGLGTCHNILNAVLYSYIRAKDFSGALQVVDDMQFEAVAFESVTNDIITGLWARKGDVRMAKSLSDKMFDEGLPPNIFVISMVVWASVELGFLQDLEKWFARPLSHAFRPDLHSFRSVVRAFASRQQAVNALRLLEVMIKNGIEPGTTACMDVLDRVLIDGDVVLAIRLIEQLRASGVQPATLLIGACIDWATKSGHLSQAQSWAEECAARGESIGEAATNAMLDAGLAAPDVDAGIKVNLPQVEGTGGLVKRASFQADASARKVAADPE